MSEGAVEPDSARTRRILGGIAFAVAAALFLGYYARKPPKVYGDGWEYLNQIESLHAHGTPDLRQEDLLAVDAKTISAQWGPAPRPPFAYRTTPDGRMYSIHFWGYSLTTVPPKAVLRLYGGNELSAMQLANAVWFVLAAFVVLFMWSAPLGKRLAYGGLVCIGPVLWYIPFTGTEVFSWAFAVTAVVAYDARKYAWSSVAAALASTQNPTLVFLCGAAIFMALWERRWREAALACVGAGLSFLPALFFKFHFGKASLIAEGFVSTSYISWLRTWSYAFDFNQGLITYEPLLVFGGIVGAVLVFVRRSAAGMVMAMTLLAVAVGTEVQVNWHSSCLGVQRYLIWMIPLVAWLMVEGLGNSWAARIFTGLAIVASGVMVDVAPFEGGYLIHNPVAKWVLNHHPELYYAEPEIFVERTRNIESPWPRDYPLPTGYVAPDGNVTKILVDPANVEAVAVKFIATPEYMEQLRAEAAGRRKHFYSHPPKGALRAREGTKVTGQ
jgi:hypothetical protein